MPIYAVRTVRRQEVNVLSALERKIKVHNIPVHAMVASSAVSGYVFIETDFLHIVQSLITGVRFVRGIVGEVPLKDIEFMVTEVSILEKLQIGQTVEIVAGPMRGMTAIVKDINKKKDEVTVSVLGFRREVPLKLKSTVLKISK